MQHFKLTWGAAIHFKLLYHFCYITEALQQQQLGCFSKLVRQRGTIALNRLTLSGVSHNSHFIIIDVYATHSKLPS